MDFKDRILIVEQEATCNTCGKTVNVEVRCNYNHATGNGTIPCMKCKYKKDCSCDYTDGVSW